MAGLSAAVALSLLIGLATTLWQWRIAEQIFSGAEQAREDERRQRTRAEDLANESRDRLSRLYVTEGTRAIDRGDPFAALHFVHLWDVATGRPLVTPIRHDGDVTFADLTANGCRLLTVENHEVFRDVFRHTARLFDVGTGELIRELCQGETNWQAAHAAVSPEGQYGVVTLYDEVHVLEMERRAAAGRRADERRGARVLQLQWQPICDVPDGLSGGEPQRGVRTASVGDGDGQRRGICTAAALPGTEDPLSPLAHRDTAGCPSLPPWHPIRSKSQRL